MPMLSTVEQTIIRILEKHCDNTIDIKTRIRVISDLYKFRWKEDESIWKQKRGKVSKYYAVYFDDEFVCGFDEDCNQRLFLLEFWKGLKKLVKENKIILNKYRAKQKRKDDEFEKQQAKIDETNRINKLPEQTPEEKMAKEVVKRVSRKKKSISSIIATKSN